MNNGCTFTLVNPCSNPHTWSWVVGNDQKRKIVNTSVWNEFLSLGDKGSRATTPARPEETRFSIWPGKPPGGGGGGFGHVHQGLDPGPDLGEAGEIISLGWSGNASGRSWWEQPGGGLPCWSCYPRDPDQVGRTMSTQKCTNFYSLNKDSC